MERQRNRQKANFLVDLEKSSLNFLGTFSQSSLSFLELIISSWVWIQSPNWDWWTILYWNPKDDHWWLEVLIQFHSSTLWIVVPLLLILVFNQNLSSVMPMMQLWGSQLDFDELYLMNAKINIPLLHLPKKQAEIIDLTLLIPQASFF